MIKRSKTEMLSDFVTGLNTTIDATSQMSAGHRLDPRWMAIRRCLNEIKESTQKAIVVK